MNKLLIALGIGFVAGRVYQKNEARILPFRWKCKVEGCGYRVFKSSPNDVMDAIQQHKREKHPGRNDVTLTQR